MVGDILVTVGRNDLPQAGGGQLRQPADGRIRDELSVEPEASNQEREEVFRDTLRRLVNSEQWADLLEDVGVVGLKDLDATAVDLIVNRSAELQAARDSRVFDIIELNPTVHAEMSAITAVAAKAYLSKTPRCTRRPFRAMSVLDT